MISRDMLSYLAMDLKEMLQKEFEAIHLSGNLAETIQIRPTEFGFEVDIPADIYDLKLWYDKGIVIYTGEGSYAQAVNESGGFSKTHTGYVEDCIRLTIEKWLKYFNLQVKGYVEE